LSPSLLELDVVKAAAGGRMLARHDGQVVLVWGAIPGERVRAQIERAGKGVLYAETIEVLTASPDRREAAPDWRCGGNVLAHVSYERQLALKGEIVQDGLVRIGRVPLAAAPPVIGSPERGYRMRARLHARNGRLGFYREGTHDLCSPASTGQLLPQTIEWLSAAESALRPAKRNDLLALEIAENIPADQRATYVELREGADPSHYDALRTGLSTVMDVLHVREDDPSSALRLRRDVRAFCQGNRFLLERLVREVVARVPAGPVVDLYAGVGLFGLSLAAIGYDAVTLVEGDRVSGTDLVGNAAPFSGRVRVHRASVESFLSRQPPSGVTYVIDPPRTGTSKEALAGIIQAKPARIVYVSCDVATLARDTRTLLDAGYELGEVTGVDLFPNTAHVETIASFEGSGLSSLVSSLSSGLKG
jgi:tRNA/tmRNA/rRNA uracil-C5-methylase (TrmA/RlmC/RlmD family)